MTETKPPQRNRGARANEVCPRTSKTVNARRRRQSGSERGPVARLARIEPGEPRVHPTSAPTPPGWPTVAVSDSVCLSAGRAQRVPLETASACRRNQLQVCSFGVVAPQGTEAMKWGTGCWKRVAVAAREGRSRQGSLVCRHIKGPRSARRGAGT